MKVEVGSCKKGWEAVFSRYWKGFDRVDGWSQFYPILMKDLGGGRICGKRGGNSFVDAIRPV